MGMGKSDYEMIAMTIKSLNIEYGLDLLAIRFAEQLALRREQFNRRMFLRACGCSDLTILAHST